MSQSPVILPRSLVVVVAVALPVLLLIFHGTDQALSPVYYATMFGLGWWAFQGRRTRAVEGWLQAIPAAPMLRCIALGYASVIFEETLVGTLFALNDGFSPGLWAQYVRQFITFNVLAFTGPILGLTLALWLLPGLSRWHLLIAGAWGVFAEGSYLLLASNPAGALLIAGPNIAVYSIILAPLVLSYPGHGLPTGLGRSLWAPVAAWGVMLAFALPSVLLLTTLRQAYPEAFPPCAYISCDR